MRKECETLDCTVEIVVSPGSVHWPGIFTYSECSSLFMNHVLHSGNLSLLSNMDMRIPGILLISISFTNNGKLILLPLGEFLIFNIHSFIRILRFCTKKRVITKLSVIEWWIEVLKFGF